MEEAIEGLTFNNFDVYVGVSAGAFIAANLANNLRTGQMCRAVVSPDPDEHPFVPGNFLMPAVGEYIKSSAKVPGFLLDALWDYVENFEERSIIKSLTRLSRAIPVGLFDNKPIRRYLERLYSRKSRTNDFRTLKKTLYVVAADLDSGKAVTFGKDGWDEVPISVAVQASTALPGLYPPVLIKGRYYVDGVLLKTLHASTILDSGVDLAICVNPIVPVDTKASVSLGYMKRGKLIDRGMPSVSSQTFRTLIHSRMNASFSRYHERFKDTAVILFEPSKEDYRMFFTNIFSFASRKAVCQHAYESTFRDLARRRDEIGPLLEKNGLRLRTEILDQAQPDLWRSVRLLEKEHRLNKRVRGHQATHQLDRALADLERLLAERKEQELEPASV